MLLHNDKELFREVVISTAEELGLVVPIVEKDYYVTMILKKLSMECPECVFIFHCGPDNNEQRPHWCDHIRVVGTYC